MLLRNSTTKFITAAVKDRYLVSFPSRYFASKMNNVDVYESINEMRTARRNWDVAAFKTTGSLAKVGFVPTMGALHDGHLNLVRKAKEECDVVVASIFINPKQFAAHEDLDKYPVTFQNDLRLLNEVGCNAVFAPQRAMMYPEVPEYKTYVTIDGIDEISEGAARPGFFRGVATVVTKLFNIVQPTETYFGQKDGLQCLVIKQTIRDLNMPVNMHIIPTSREADGLAMSSRNVYLDSEERALAPCLYKGLLALEARYKSGERNVDKLRSSMSAVIESYGSKVGIQYISIADADTADEVFGTVSKDLESRGIFVSAAIRLGSTRLIDNIVVKL